MCLRWLIVFCLFLMGSNCVAEETETVEIPLSEIWALNMPGTKNVESLDQSQMELPIHTLSISPMKLLPLSKTKEAGPGFVVIGTGQEALIASHRKLPEGSSPPNVFPYGKEMSIVYYSYWFPPHIVLDRVVRRGFDIEISYKFEPSGAESFSSHFALIPLGFLAAGKYQVRITDLSGDVFPKFPSKSPAARRDLLHRSVCSSFQFEVIAPQVPEASSQLNKSQE